MTSVIKNESNRGRGHARTVTKFWNPRIKFCPLICLHRRKTMPVVNDGGDLGQRARHRPTCRRLLPHSQERHVSSMLQTLSFPPLSRPRRHHKMIGRATQRGRRRGTVGIHQGRWWWRMLIGGAEEERNGGYSRRQCMGRMGMGHGRQHG